ncbi:MAG: class I SAM-dependent methyltransferase [Caulobacter sp.]|jgi:SAM-dependent methyltransferase|nr:class I SAM-dependent methyltransferase [Caulobacter sp.]
MTNIWDRHVMPRLIGCACASKPIMKQREKIVPRASGKVLELGVGGGLNLRYYDPARVEGVWGVDPSAELRERALAAPRPDGLKVDIRDGVGESLPFANASFDCVVCTFTLCSVQSPVTVLAEARRVLKPGGRLLYAEHGLAPDDGVAAWQKRIEPMWKAIAGGCHLTRIPTRMVLGAGFSVGDTDRMYLPGTPKLLGWSEWGEAHVA